MNPMEETAEIESKELESDEGQTINEEVNASGERKLTLKGYKKVPSKYNPMKRNFQFKLEGIYYEVVDTRKRDRAFIRMLGIPVYVDEQGREVQL
jgi:hypothetical protein